MAADNIPNGDEQITDEDAELWLDAVEYYVEAGLEADESHSIITDEYEQASGRNGSPSHHVLRIPSQPHMVQVLTWKPPLHSIGWNIL